MTTRRRVTCVLINETDQKIIATGAELNFKIEQGKLVDGMPCPIAPGERGTFTLVQGDAPVGPSGWACYELEGKDLVYQIRFDDPGNGPDSYTIGLNFYRVKLGDGVTSVAFSGPSGALTLDAIVTENDLTVEYHLGYKADAQVPATDPNANSTSAKPVLGPPGSSATLVVPPYFARWDQKGITQRRRKILAAIYKTYPLIWDATDAPGKAVAPQNGGNSDPTKPWNTYRKMGPWTSPGTSCTSSCPLIGGAVSPTTASHWNFAAYSETAGWTPWGTPNKKMPSVGDIYLLVRDEVVRPLPPAPSTPRPKPPKADASDAEKAQYAADKKLWAQYDSKVALLNPHERHVGIVCEVPTTPDEVFITADGGQKAYGLEAAHIAKRYWLKKAPGPSDSQYMSVWEQYMKAPSFAFAKPPDGMDCVYFVGGAESKTTADGNRLVGWIDVDLIDFGPEDFDAKYTQEDYEAMGARIDSVRAIK